MKMAQKLFLLKIADEDMICGTFPGIGKPLQLSVCPALTFDIKFDFIMISLNLDNYCKTLSNLEY